MFYPTPHHTRHDTWSEAGWQNSSGQCARLTRQHLRCGGRLFPLCRSSPRHVALALTAADPFPPTPFASKAQAAGWYYNGYSMETSSDGAAEPPNADDGAAHRRTNQTAGLIRPLLLSRNRSIRPSAERRGCASRIRSRPSQGPASRKDGKPWETTQQHIWLGFKLDGVAHNAEVRGIGDGVAKRKHTIVLRRIDRYC